MKLAIIYFSKTGNTRIMAQEVATGMEKVAGTEAKTFSLDDIDDAFIEESRAVVFGTPTYYANTCWQMKKWFDESRKYDLSGKLGAVFATAHYAQGGADTAILNILGHLMVKGMLVYSGGSALGQPFIHLGAVAIDENFEQSKPMFQIFGERIAQKAVELFGE